MILNGDDLNQITLNRAVFLNVYITFKTAFINGAYTKTHGIIGQAFFVSDNTYAPVSSSITYSLARTIDDFLTHEFK